MLHEINLPHSWKYLKWILALQHRLLVNLCDPELTPDQVTVDWVKAKLPKLPPEWVKSFCTRKFKEKRMLTRMKTIAGINSETKAQLLSDFEHDVNFQSAINDAQKSYRFHSLQVLENNSHKNDIRYFFESFYSAQFYFAAKNSRSGYYIPNHGKECVRYHHTRFIEDFDAGQAIKVCSFCDGALSGVQVDHFYPKSQYPFLSCHPLNLVPVCGECNKEKSEREPLDNAADNGNTFVNWPHPYLCSLAKAFTIKFVRDDNPLRPEIECEDDATNRQMRNLESLVGLKRRWQKALELRVAETKVQLDGYRRYLQRKGRNSNLTTQALADKLDLWTWELAVGTDSFGLLGKAYLQQAAAQNPIIFEELEKHSQTEMPTLV